MVDVWDSALEGSTAVHVMAVLANSADDDGTNCFPGTRLIARRARVSERTVVRTIQELESQGWLWVIRRGLGAGNRTRLQEQATATRQRERCHSSVTFSQRKRKVTPATAKGDIHARKGDIDAPPLFVLPVSDSSADPAPPAPSLPRGSERDRELDLATEQLRNALSVENGRVLRMLRRVIALAAEKGEPPATIALAMIAAVREQDAACLKFKFGLRKFFGEGIWRDKNRWAWDVERARREAEARVGSR
jgi:hypothetical protein